MEKEQIFQSIHSKLNTNIKLFVVKQVLWSLRHYYRATELLHHNSSFFLEDHLKLYYKAKSMIFYCNIDFGKNEEHSLVLANIWWAVCLMKHIFYFYFLKQSSYFQLGIQSDTCVVLKKTSSSILLM